MFSCKFPGWRVKTRLSCYSMLFSTVAVYFGTSSVAETKGFSVSHSSSSRLVTVTLLVSKKKQLCLVPQMADDSISLMRYQPCVISKMYICSYCMYTHIYIHTCVYMHIYYSDDTVFSVYIQYLYIP